MESALRRWQRSTARCQGQRIWWETRLRRGENEIPPQYGAAGDGDSDPAAIDASASSTSSGSVDVDVEGE